MEKSAVLDESGRYRYRLSRRWEEGDELVFVLLNPSTADATEDDPTLRRCVGFARRMGFGGLVVVNLFALRATDPRSLATAADPVGPDNDAHILGACEAADRVLLGWGNHGLLHGRGEKVWRRLGACHHLGLTARDQPRHPLYLRRDTPLVGPQTWPGGEKQP